MNNARVSGRDTSYEWKIVVLLALGFGLVGVDRFMIMPLFPVMMRDLKLDYQDLGHITAALSVAWGASALLTGNLPDRFGHRKVIIPAMLAFSLLACASGLAWGVGSLMAIRAVMGFAEGVYTPSSITATLDASNSARHGRNVGIQQAALRLFGLGIAPIVVTQLIRVVPWHWIFAMVVVPGLVVCVLTWKVLRDTSAERTAAHTGTADAGPYRWLDVLHYRNVPLYFVGMLCWLTCLIVLNALLPNYLTDYLHLGLQQMGFVLSATGVGGPLGGIAMPALFDRIGRRPVMVLSVLGAFVSLWSFSRTGAEPVALFAGLLATIFFVFAMITLTVGPISAEAVPAQLMTTASGLVIGVGEIFGGGIAPSVAGYVAKHFGIQYIMQLGMGALMVGFCIALLLKETAPCRTRPTIAASIGS